MESYVARKRVAPMRIRIAQPVAQNVAELHSQIARWREEGAESVEIDLEGVELLDSLSIGALVRLQVACRQSGIRLSTVGLNDGLRRSLATAGVAQLLVPRDSGVPDIDDEIG